MVIFPIEARMDAKTEHAQKIEQTLTEQARASFGSEDAVRTWLYTSNMFLEGRTPIEVAAKSEEGLETIKTFLCRIEHNCA